MLHHLLETESTKVKHWLKVAIKYYVDGYSEEDITDCYEMSMYVVKRDKLLGTVRIATRFKLRSLLTE